MNKAKFLIPVSFLICSISFADILFLDLNGNPKEIETAERAAAKRKEKLIVIPKVTESQRKQMLEITNQLNKLYETSYSACVRGMSTEECQRARLALRELSNRDYEMKSKIQIRRDNLTAELKALKEKNINISSLVVSGHDGNGHFGGTQGSLSDRDLAEAFKSADPVGANIRSLLLWGCYTANIGSLTTNWKNAFPQVDLIAGYDGSAPLGDKPANWMYLEDVLIQEKKLTSIKDERELQKALKRLQGANMVHSSLCVGDKFASQKKTADLKEALKMCGDITNEVQEIYTCYLHAERPKCENPPANTSSSELRSLYNKLQDGRHCLEAQGITRSNIPSPEATLRLIYFKNIKANLVKNYSEKISYFNDLLGQVGAPDDLKWPDIKSMSRADIIEKLNAQRDYLNAAYKKGGPFTPELDILKKGQFAFQRLLGDVKVDFPWVEPDALPGNSDTIAFRTLNNEALTSSRSKFETTRASNLINNEFRKIAYSDPEVGEKLRKIDQEIADLHRKFQESPKSEKDDPYEKLSRLNLSKSSLISASLDRLTPKLDSVVERLKTEPYDNPAGKKEFVSALDQIVQTKRFNLNVIASPESIEPESIGGFGYGGFGLGMPPPSN